MSGCLTPQEVSTGTGRRDSQFCTRLWLILTARRLGMIRSLRPGGLALSECSTCGMLATDAEGACPGCGASLATAAVAAAAGVDATILFSDVTGFTTIAERLDPEALRGVMEGYFVAMRDVIERRGGRVEKFIGDAVLAVFGLSVGGEDHAERALLAAVEIREALVQVNTTIPSGLDVELTASTGVCTGELFARAGRTAEPGGQVVGDAIGVAMRLEAAAGPGEVLIDGSTLGAAGVIADGEPVEFQSGASDQRFDAFWLRGLGSPSSGPAPASPLAELSRRQSRKTVTVLFTDVAWFKAIGDRLDPARLRELMDAYFAAVSQVIRRHGGRVEEAFVGDPVMAVFGLPRVREDDALRAVRAALEVEDGLAGVRSQLPPDLGVDLRASTGVNTGEVFALEDPSGKQVGEVTGDAVNVAARLRSAAGPGDVLLGLHTLRVTRSRVDAEPLQLSLKGKGERVAAYRVLALHGPAIVPDGRRRLTARTVGREAEAAALARAFAEAGAEERCRLVTVLGAAGSGKSRLIRDALAAFEGRARILVGRCLPYGEATIYWPFTEIVCQAAGISPGAGPDQAITAIARLLAADPIPADLVTAERLAGALGLGPLTGSPDELPSDLATLMRALAADGPLVVVVEDIHWAAGGLLSALERLAARVVEGAPVLLLCAARPELLESRPDWPGGATSSATISLEALGEADCATLVGELLGGGDAAEELVGPVQAVASGNPLVIEEILAMLADDGMLVREQETWVLTRAVEEIRIPPTIEAILGARLDRLTEPEREVLAAAAVIGKEFDLAEVDALCAASRDGGPHSTMLADTLAALLRKQFIERARGGLSDYSFHHILIRDAAYGATPKRRRAHLHERYADHVEGSTSALRGGADGEMVGEHLERSCALRRELGAGDDELGELAHRAGARLADAGRRAHALSDSRAARRIYARGEAVLGRGDPLRVELLTGLAEATLDCGVMLEARAAASDAVRLADLVGAGAARSRAALIGIQADVALGEDSLEQAQNETHRIVDELERAADERALVWGLMALVHLGLASLRFTEAAIAGARAVEIVRRSAPADLPYCVVGLCGAVANAPLPPAVAWSRCEEALSLLQPDTLYAAYIEARALAVLDAMAGRFEAARERFARSTEVCERYGADGFACVCELEWGMCELMARDFDAADAHLSRSRNLVVAFDKQSAAEAEAVRAIAFARTGRFEAALEKASAAAEVLTANTPEAQILWRLATALALIGTGDAGAAERPAREALAIARPTESPQMLGEALACLGEVLLAQGRRGEGVQVLEDALEAFEGKGIWPRVAAVRALLDAQCAPYLRRPSNLSLDGPAGNRGESTVRLS